MTITPFRWPGAKNKLIPILMDHIDPLMINKNEFCDAFVGGGSILLEVAKKYPQMQLFANDKDSWISSFWKIVSDIDSNKLFELLKLVETKPTIELFYKLRAAPPMTIVERAYYAIFFNRTTFSGIAKSGPIGGKDQKSQYTVDCRYNHKKLKEKILACNKLLAGRTTIENKDFSEYDPLIKTDMPAYLDPPYYVKGSALYIENMKHGEHVALASILGNRLDWVLSYDDHPTIRDLYAKSSIVDLAARYCINGKKNTWENKNELIIHS